MRRARVTKHEFVQSNEWEGNGLARAVEGAVVTALHPAVVGWLVGALVSALYVLPPDQAPVREAPEWARTVERGSTPDYRVDPEYQRMTQRRCMRWYQRHRR